MTVARSVRDVLTEHVLFEVDCVDRMYLQRVCAAACSTRRVWSATCIGSWRLPIASTAPLARITDAFDTAVHRFARDHGVPWVDFAKGQRKDDVMHEHLGALHRHRGGAVRRPAQEKTTLFRTEKRRDANGDSYPWIVKASAGLVNHFYFYCVDDDFGPFFLKFCSYFPYNAKLCLNGHEWAKRQAAKAGIAFERAGQRVRRGRRPRGAAGDLRPARVRRRSTPCCASGWPGPAASVQPRRPRRRLPLRPVDPAGRVLPDPDAGPARVRAGLLRAGHPRQPRHRPPRPGRADLRPAVDAPRAHARRRADSAPG